jgi:hypothetical protein
MPEFVTTSAIADVNGVKHPGNLVGSANLKCALHSVSRQPQCRVSCRQFSGHFAGVWRTWKAVDVIEGELRGRQVFNEQTWCFYRWGVGGTICRALARWFLATTATAVQSRCFPFDCGRRANRS